LSKFNRATLALQSIADVQAGWFAIYELTAGGTEVTRVLILGLYKPEVLSTAKAAKFSMFLRMLGNQIARLEQHHDRGLISEKVHVEAIGEFTPMMDTPGGRQCRKAEPRWDDWWGREMQPFIARDRSLR
jgi:hypothetical protein